MLDSNQIERALEAQGFTLEKNNTHARGFLSADKERLLYVKTSRGLEEDPLKPVYKQPLVLHWSIKNSSQFFKLEQTVPSINSSYKNENMNGFEGPKKDNKGNGVAIDIASTQMLAEVLSILGVTTNQNMAAEEDIAAAIPELDKLPATTRKSIIDARIGQGKFREGLIDYWQGCAVTGCEVYKMLRASHIKPWRDSNNAERLSHYNGLLLTANLDQAFDQGMISFDENGKILIKFNMLNEDALATLHIKNDMRLRQISNEHQAFLAGHRRMHNF